MDAVLPELCPIEEFPWRDAGTGKAGTEAGGPAGSRASDSVCASCTHEAN